MEPIVVFITAGSKDEAEKISDHLVNEKIVACCNVVSPVQSTFFWQGNVCRENEVLILAKTTRARFQELITTVKLLHSYETPEIIALPIIDGSHDYLKWIADETAA
ncbi:divalent-cation tolerance protein CutA [candidate division KSB1 bacterium]|nr:divalent-cation tolerance protein CutA [candidate division KSB1 bacterium]